MADGEWKFAMRIAARRVEGLHLTFLPGINVLRHRPQLPGQKKLHRLPRVIFIPWEWHVQRDCRLDLHHSNVEFFWRILFAGSLSDNIGN